MRELIELDIPVEHRQVDIIHILNDGEIILNSKEFEKHQEKFTWVNKNQIVDLVLSLRPLTDSHRKSIIAIYQTGEIKTYPNISKNFTKYNLLNKARL